VSLEKNVMKKELLNSAYIIVGAICMSLAIAGFFAKNQIAAGGPPGISIIINHLTGTSLGLLLFLINFPLMLLGYKKFGRYFTLKTLVIVFTTSLFTDIWFWLLSDYIISNDTMINTLFGGMLLGAGIGLMFKSGGASGGWSVLARIIAEKVKMKVGKVTIALDCIVLILFVVVFGHIETFLYGVIGIFVAGKMIDLVIIGSTNIKTVHISCDNANTIVPFLSQTLCSPGSIIQCRKMINNEQKDLILLSVKQDKVTTLCRVIKEQDPKAYMVISDATEIFGID